MSFYDRKVAEGQNQVDLRNTRNANDEELFTHHHDLPTTTASVQEILSGGTPDWVKRPHEWKNYAREAFAREKEISDEMVERYQMEDQHDLTNSEARLINKMGTDDFIEKLRNNPVCPVKCFTVYNGLPGTIALWCLPPRAVARARYVCYLRTPYMYEWSLLKLDNHGLPAGELRGWRTVIVELIKSEILTEWQANQIFGTASERKVYRRYHQSLWEIRHGKRLTQDELAAKEA